MLSFIRSKSFIVEEDENDEKARKIIEEITQQGISPDLCCSEYIDILTAFGDKCKQKGKYDLASLAFQTVQMLKNEEESREIIQIDSVQKAEIEDLEEAQIIQIEEIKKLWDEKQERFEKQINELYQKLKERHRKELKALKEETIDRTSPPKFSTKLLNLRHIEKKLANQNQFEEAKRVKSEADQLELKEIQQMDKTKKVRHEKKEKALKKNHETETQAFEQRIEMGRLALLTQRINDMNKIIQRFKNLKSDAEHRHKMLIIKTGSLLQKSMNNPKAVHSPFNSMLIEKDLEKISPRHGSALEYEHSHAQRRTIGTNDSFKIYNNWCKGTLASSPRKSRNRLSDIAPTLNSKPRNNMDELDFLETSENLTQ